MATLDVSTKEFPEVKATAEGDTLTVQLGADRLILSTDQAGALADELAPYSDDDEEEEEDDDDED